MTPRARHASILAALAAVTVLATGALLTTQFHATSAVARDGGADAFERTLRTGYETRGTMLARVLAAAMVQPLYRNDLSRMSALLRDARLDPDVIRVSVFDAQGRVVHDGSDADAGPGRPMSAPLGGRAAEAGVWRLQENGGELDIIHPVYLGDTHLGDVRLTLSLARLTEEVAAHRAELEALHETAAPRHLLLLGLALVVAMLGAAAVASAISRRLSGGADERATGPGQDALAWARDRRLADSVFTRSSEGIVIADAQGHVLQVNPAFQQLTGMKTADLRGQSLAAIGARTADGDDLAMVMDALAREGRWEGEIWHQRAGGRVNPLWLSAAAVLDTTGNVEHYTAIFIDLGALKDAEKRIHHLAYFDSLTNLPNRMLFQDRLHQALTQAQRHGELVGVLLIDLDRFKVINDTKGHAFGDLLLRHVAQRLRGALREEDTVARLGGDEFAVIVPGLRDAEDATLVAQKVLGLFGPAFAIDGEEFYTAASIGLSLFPVDAREAEMLIANADAALFRAKEHGRSVYRFFTPDMNDRVAEVMEIEHGLRQAIERNELTLCYQPQFDLRSGAPVGVEALLRWKSRRLGHVPPALFIPVAEECGLIGVIGEWMLREACRQASDWRRRGLAPVRMAVNLSARQFSDPRLLAQIEHALAASDLDPEALEVEITESVVMTDLDRSIATLMRLNELGVRIAVDDFGTGYSSLSYLKRFPLHALKIDRSFIRDVMEDADDAAITGAIIHMGHSLGLTVIAEGVENPGHESFLRAHDCDLAQGYFYGRAVSACEVEKLLSRRALPAAVC